MGYKEPNLMNNIAKGRIPANIPLTNISTAYLQSKNEGSALDFFPKCPVKLSSSYFYKFDKASLLRDNVRRKPILGKVDPTIIGSDTDNYKCEPWQIILGLDEISQADLLRTGAPGMMDVKKSKSKIIAEQLFIHRNKDFAANFFNSSAWSNTKAGSTDFTQFDDSASDPIAIFTNLITDMKRNTGRKPNKLGLGINTYNALINHEAIKERVIYGGSTPNPALVNETALAAILGIDKVVVFDAIWNSAGLGQEEDMEFICDENAALLCYSTNTPAVDEATAGYTFTWDMGIGQENPIVTWDGDDFTYSEYIGGMVAYDMKKVCDDLGVFLSDCVSAS